MIDERARRRLAAILAADVVGYSRLIGADEEGTLAALKAHLVAPHMVAYRPKVKEFVLSSKLQILEPA